MTFKDLDALKKSIEISPAPHLLCDRQGHILAANSAMSNLPGIDFGPIESETVVGIFANGHQLTKKIHRCIDGREEIRFEMRLNAWDPLESTCRHASLSIL